MLQLRTSAVKFKKKKKKKRFQFEVISDSEKNTLLPRGIILLS